jgi:phage repressor protein C with HTH and peptisase S24 domain
MNEAARSLCARLAMVRQKHYGGRGKARFARQLGISATTYQHYEVDRSPPVELLLQAAQCTGSSLHWLLTGQGSMDQELGAPTAAHPVVERAREMVARRPELVQSLSWFLDLLEKLAVTVPPHEQAGPQEAFDTALLVPIVGSTAAGFARFWEEIEPSDVSDINRRMQALLSDYEARAVHTGGVAPAGMDATNVASLVQLSRPDELGFVEFLSCPSVKAAHPRAVAWRIDGDSMAPRYEDGDFVIVSSDVPAVDGYPCVAHQEGQIGVNCKIYSRSRDDVMLIPVNEASRPQLVKVGEIVWAYRVLYSVRLSGRM